MGRESRSEHVRYRYGICLNEKCSKCTSKEIQEVSVRKELVCAECGKPLRECPKPKTTWQKYGKLIMGGSVGILAIVVIVIITSLGGSKKANPDGGVIDSTTVTKVLPRQDGKTEDQKIGENIPKDTVTVETEPKEFEKTGLSEPKGPSVSWGEYSGPTNGIGGEIKVTKSYSLKLNNANGDVLYLSPGDVIQQTKFQNGQLRQGVWIHNGERQFFTR